MVKTAPEVYYSVFGRNGSFQPLRDAQQTPERGGTAAYIAENGAARETLQKVR